MVPKQPPNTGAAYIKFLPRTADDYATVSAAAVLTLDKSMKTIADVRIALGSVGVTPILNRSRSSPARPTLED
jgi:CO/xanthine dehydrogenase FAD-binding subunit